jgi:CRISPR-associated protein Cmr6
MAVTRGGSLRDMFELVCSAILKRIDDDESELRKISPYSLLNLFIYCRSLYVVDSFVPIGELRKKGAELFSKASSYIVRRVLEESEKHVGGVGGDFIEDIMSYSVFGFSPLNDSLARSGLKLIIRRYRAVQRVIYGASSGIGKNLFGVGLEIDPLYGIPVIRGSGVKGAVRSCAEIELENYKKVYASRREVAGMKNPEELGRLISTLFGCSSEDRRRYESCRYGLKESVGAAIFLDAYPIYNANDQYIVVPEVITPHYMREGREILDEASAKPVPIVHISISFGTVFVFPIVIDLLRLRAAKIASEDTAERLLDRWLKCALEEIGIGQRTSVGYGVFKMHEERR